MTASAEAPPVAAIGPRSRLAHWLRLRAMSPARLFVWLSLAFGLPLVALVPPLRGADEPAHLLRAYGIARGEIIPAERVDGRVGIRLPARLHADFSLFEDARYRFAETDIRYGEIFDEYAARDTTAASGQVRRAVFVPYQGSEAYTPVAYIPYAAVAYLGRMVGADFLSMLYAMRVVGLLVSTAIIAAAIAVAPGIRWPLLLIALLPSALHGRATISADGAAIGLAMLVAALALRAGMAYAPLQHLGQRILWMTLCILVKPSQLALAPVELLASRWPHGRWWIPAAVILPGAALTGVWVTLIGGEVAAWRLTDGGLPAEQFQIGWKLGYMAAHPLHFAELLANSIWLQAPALYQQMIGVLGWLDTPLAAWVYPALGLALLLAMTERLPCPRDSRISTFAISALTAAGYVVFIYFLLYVTWTPVTADQIWGIQGRYFVPALPTLAVAVATALPRGRRGALAGPAAACGALIAGFAAIDAVWRTNW